MYTSRVLEGSDLSAILYPPFRKVNFASAPAVVLVSSQLRELWTAVPDEDTFCAGVGAAIKARHELTENQRKALPKNPNFHEFDTPWRRSLYYNWNHVFVDVARFLVEVGPGIGDFVPPSHEVFPLHLSDTNDTAIMKAWNTNVFLIFAHLQNNVAIRAAIVEDTSDKSEKTLGVFDKLNNSEIWFIKKGVKVKLYVEHDNETDTQSLAAVMVVGIISTDEQQYVLEDESEADVQPDSEVRGTE